MEAIMWKPASWPSTPYHMSANSNWWKWCSKVSNAFDFPFYQSLVLWSTRFTWYIDPSCGLPSTCPSFGALCAWWEMKEAMAFKIYALGILHGCPRYYGTSRGRRTHFGCAESTINTSNTSTCASGKQRHSTPPSLSDSYRSRILFCSRPHIAQQGAPLLDNWFEQRRGATTSYDIFKPRSKKVAWSAIVRKPYIMEKHQFAVW